MEIDRSNFWRLLPQVLEAISDADYVSFDLEMTGVGFKSGPKILEPSAEEIYQQAKEAAQVYQVLQVGLTCLQHDQKSGGYRSRTFNFSLTPLFVGTTYFDKLIAKIIDRTVSFSYTSFLFLQRYGFDFEKVFSNGIPYLSRQESQIANELLQNPSEAKVEPCDIDKLDSEARGFYFSTKRQIFEWLMSTESSSYVNISSPNGGRMTSLQINLVYRITHDFFKDYPQFPQFRNCRIFKGDDNRFMQIVKLDEKNQEHWEKWRQELKDGIVKQNAFRYIIEALVGGDFATEINLEFMTASTKVASDETSAAAMPDIFTKFKTIEAKLKERRPVVIGHYQFHDLCFIYQTFLGTLPPTLDEFRHEIHRLFPRIVDTKYLTSAEGERSLEELYSSAKRQDFPRLNPVSGFVYFAEPKHEAGFDSWMTAVVFAKTALLLKLTEDKLLKRLKLTEDKLLMRKTAVASNSIVSRTPSYTLSPSSAFAMLNPFALTPSPSPSPVPPSETGNQHEGKTTATTTIETPSGREVKDAECKDSGAEISTVEDDRLEGSGSKEGKSEDDELEEGEIREDEIKHIENIDIEIKEVEISKFEFKQTELQEVETKETEIKETEIKKIQVNEVEIKNPKVKKELVNLQSTKEGVSGKDTNTDHFRVPRWESKFWERYGNRLRVGKHLIYTDK